MSSAAEPVQEQIRERYQSLQAALERQAPPPSWPRPMARWGSCSWRPSPTMRRTHACVTRGSSPRTTCDGRTFSATCTGIRTSPRKLLPSFEQALDACAQRRADARVAGRDASGAEPSEPPRSRCKKAQTLDPRAAPCSTVWDAWRWRSRTTQQAVKYLEAALCVARRRTRLHYPLALAYRGLGNRDKAEEHLRLRGEVELPPADPLLGEVSGLLQNAAAYRDPRFAGARRTAMGRGRERIYRRRWSWRPATRSPD